MVSAHEEYSRTINYECLLLHWLGRMHDLYIKCFTETESFKKWVSNALAFVEAVKMTYRMLAPQLKEDVRGELNADPEELLAHMYDIEPRGATDHIANIMVALPDQQVGTNNVRQATKTATIILVEKASRIATAIVNVLDKHGLLFHKTMSLKGCLRGARK